MLQSRILRNAWSLIPATATADGSIPATATVPAAAKQEHNDNDQDDARCYFLLHSNVGCDAPVVSPFRPGEEGGQKPAHQHYGQYMGGGAQTATDSNAQRFESYQPPTTFLVWACVATMIIGFGGRLGDGRHVTRSVADLADLLHFGTGTGVFLDLVGTMTFRVSKAPVASNYRETEV
ncbi:hypothetical protein [Ensifer sp. 22564]|uniref:hypothetical protein n=1 Tax=unclassified Ensifer TaxID=2633371 RepID=UPI003F846D23